MTALLDIENLSKHFPGGVRAVDGISFHIAPGETLALVGESGCGKSTTSRLALRLLEPTTGSIRFNGEDLRTLSPAALRRRRRDMQIVFQDPYASLNPRMTIGEIIAEPLRVHGLAPTRAAMQARVAELLDRVGLPPDAAARYPRQFSGGQRQRIGIARAIGPNPSLVVADEPVSALDVSLQGQVVNLLQDLQEQLGLSYLFVAHDLAVVRHIAHRVAVMYLGVIVETAPADRLFAAPHHPYTQALLSAAPEPEPGAVRNRIILQGEIPSPRAIPPGCRVHTRCPLAQDICRAQTPPNQQVAPGHTAACHFAAPYPIPTESRR